MGGRGSGRRAKPSALKKAQGNPGKRKLNEREPQVEPGEPEMPAGLPKLAQQEWRDIVPRLLEMGVLTRVDGKALAAYCVAYSLAMTAAATIEKKGVFVKGAYGELKESPAVRVQDKALKLMKSFLIEFGLTPASRSKLKIEPKSESDPFAEFLTNRKSVV